MHTRQGATTLGIALMLALLVLVIGGIAWVVQFLPNWRAREKGDEYLNAVNKAMPGKLIKFREPGPGIRACWEPRIEDKIRMFGEDDYVGYHKEFEHRAHGHYDFSFENTSPDTAEIGLLETNCDCSRIEVAVLPQESWYEWEKSLSGWEGAQSRKKYGLLDRPEPAHNISWQVIQVKDESGVVVPGHGKGILRVSWEGRKQVYEKLRLSPVIWMQPRGVPRLRQIERVDVLAVVVAPVQFENQKVSVGPFFGGRANKHFLCWSATRKDLKLQVKNDDPLFDWQLRRLVPGECEKLEMKLRGEKLLTRVADGYLISLTIYEQKGDRLIDQGPFERQPPVYLDGEPLTSHLPVIYGQVRGDVEVGDFESRGRINLQSFSSRLGTKKHVVLWSPKGVGLQIEKWQPATLEIQLKKIPEESTTTKTRWDLEIHVPANAQVGSLPDQSAVILRTLGMPMRLIRIPIEGTAVQG
jgi:hypothetical protein